MDIPVTPGTLPAGACPTDYQSLLELFSANQTVTVPDVSITLYASMTTPPVSLNGKVGWLRLDSSSNPIRLYWFVAGSWLSLHPEPPGTVKMYNGDVTNFVTFDGGDASATPGPASGPMWEIALSAVIPIGVGTLPSGKVLKLGDTGGEETHKLTAQEMFPHTHNEKVAVNRAVTNGGTIDTSGNGGFVGPIGSGGTEIITGLFGGEPSSGNPPTDSLGHNTLPVYQAVYFLRRTDRLFYAIP